MLKRTPLFAVHQELGARLVEFGGWEMPVQYTSIVDEHLAVRRAAGVFDASHMGEVAVSGPGGLAFLNLVLTNDARKLAVGRSQYSLMCNEHGGVIDDLFVCRMDDAEFLLIINASRIETDVAWLQTQVQAPVISGEIRLRNLSDELGLVAVQGPAVTRFIDRSFMGQITGGAAVERPTDLKRNQITRLLWQNQPIWISRTGYTGEDGFEILAPVAALEAVWRRLLELGSDHGLKPAGLGARDTLRTEAGYSLYGHELDEKTTPLEAGLGAFVALDKPEFVGRAALAQQQAQGLRKQCVAFKMTDRSAPPRPHYPICGGAEDRPIGEVVSGTQSPSLGIGIGMGYVPPAFAQTDTPLWIEIRGKRWPARVVPRPIYRKPV